MARYCSSLARSSSSSVLRAVMSRPMYSTCGSPWCRIGTPRVSMSKRVPSLLRASASNSTRSPASARCVQLPHVLVQLRRAHGEAAAAERLLAPPAAHRLVRRVDVDHAEVGVAQHQRVGAGVEDRAVLLLARAQRLHRALALGDLARHREDMRPAGDVDLLQRHLVPVQRPVVVAPAPLEAQRPAPGAHFADQAQRLLVGVRELVSAQVAHREAAQLLARVAERAAGLGVHVEDRAAVVVVDEDRVLGGLEDGAVVRLRLGERLHVHAPLELGAGAHGEDLQHRLEQLLVDDRLAREHRDHADRPAGGVLQRVAGVAHTRLWADSVVGVALGHAARHDTEAAARPHPRHGVTASGYSKFSR